MCQIVQDVRTCLFRHTKRPGKCVRLYRISEPVYSDTPRDQGNVSDCTGCQNLSIPTHQETREMCQIVQDVRICLFRHTRRPGKCVRLYRMLEYSGFILVNRNTLGPYIFVGCHRMSENSGGGFHCTYIVISKTGVFN
jgi:hypothetical protein